MDGVIACRPISKFWYRKESGYCVPEFELLIAGTVGSLVCDAMVILLPMPQVFKLDVKWSRKMMLAVAFALAYL